ncbi:MAG: tetratricopeptide repeat protein [Nannocystales bacterium]
MRIQNIFGLIALSVALSTAPGCKKKNPDTTSPTGGPGAATDPSKASAEAKKAFSDVAARYDKAAASGKLSAGQCESFSKDFAAVYKEYGTQMTIAWFNSGAVLEECGKTEAAEKIYEAIIKKEPKFDLAYNNLGVIYWNRKKESKALDYFKRAVEANPKTKAPRNNLAAALRDKYSSDPKSDDFSKAERNLQTVLAVDSSNQLAYENLARLYYDRGRLKDKSYILLADLVVTQSLRVFGETGVESPDIYNIKGLIFMERENQVDALKAFSKAASLKPDHADAHMNIAMISIRFRDYAQAEKSLNIALKDSRQKKNVETFLGLGVAQRGLRKYKDAEKSFKKALDMSAKDPRALYNLGVLYQSHIGPASDTDGLKDNDTAKGYFNKFISKAGSNKELTEFVADAKQRISNIEQFKKDVAEMKALLEESNRLEELQKKQEAEERKRLLDLEKKARDAAAGASAAAAPAPPAEEKK